MMDLQNAGDSRETAQIDRTGWVFAAVVVLIAAIAGILAYHGRDVVVASNPVIPHAEASH
jgi:hypothetical protein